MHNKHISLLTEILLFAAGIVTGFSLRGRIEAKTDSILDTSGKSEMKPEDFFTEEELKSDAHC